MAILQDTIILRMTPGLVDLPHIKEWVPQATHPHPATAASILPNTDPQVPRVTQAPAQEVLVPTTTTPDRGLHHAGALRDNTTRTLEDPMQVLKCTAGVGTAQGILPGQDIQEDHPFLRQVLRDNQLKQITIPVVSSIRISSRREELDLRVPLVQAPDPPVQEDLPDPGSCRGPRSRSWAVLPTPLSCELTPQPPLAPRMTLFPWPSLCRESLTHMVILEWVPRVVDLLEAPCLPLEDKCILEVLLELPTNQGCLQAHSLSIHLGLQ